MLRGASVMVAEIVRQSDVVEIAAPAGPHEEVMRCALEDAHAVHDLVKDCDGIVHLGGISVEKAYDPIEDANLRGVYNLYEAARANGKPRILFASTNHTIGYYPQGTQLTPEMPFLPDGLYGRVEDFRRAMASPLSLQVLSGDGDCPHRFLYRESRWIGACFPPGSAMTISSR